MRGSLKPDEMKVPSMIQTHISPAAASNARDVDPEYEARELTQGGNLATIMLDSQKYLLRITRQGKLILTK